MSSGIGQALRKARTERAIVLDEVERVTKIRVKFLEAMEDDRWDALPAPAYARGFLEIYARFLELDDRALVDEYSRTVEGAGRRQPIPEGVVRPGSLTRTRARRAGVFTHARRRASVPVRPLAALIAGLAAVVVLVAVVVGSLGGPDDGGGSSGEHRGQRDGSGRQGETSAATPGAPSEVSLELRSTGEVWVCVVDASDRALVNETLPPGESRGPFEGRSFDLTFGNGSIQMTVDGEPARVPSLAEPLGYRVTPTGARRLDPSSRPSCS